MNFEDMLLVREVDDTEGKKEENVLISLKYRQMISLSVCHTMPRVSSSLLDIFLNYAINRYYKPYESFMLAED